MKINELDINYSGKVTDKFIELCKKGKISYSDELKFFNYINDKYKPITIPDYSRLKNRNHKLINDDFDNSKLAGIIFGGKKFIYSSLND